MSGFDASYEVLVLEGSRWNVKHVTDNQGEAMATAMEMSKRPGCHGVRVIKDYYDEREGLSYEKVLFEQLKEKQGSGVRRAAH